MYFIYLYLSLQVPEDNPVAMEQILEYITQD